MSHERTIYIQIKSSMFVVSDFSRAPETALKCLTTNLDYELYN